MLGRVKNVHASACGRNTHANTKDAIKTLMIACPFQSRITFRKRSLFMVPTEAQSPTWKPLREPLTLLDKLCVRVGTVRFCVSACVYSLLDYDYV